MKKTFVNSLLKCAREDKSICLLTGDLGFGLMEPFYEEFPKRFINCGIAEQNMIGIAAGMAREGKKVIVYSIGNFTTLRCLEQIRNDCLYHDADVKIVSVGGGFAYGALGMSHHATEDIAIMRALPNITVFAPGDLLETKLAVEKMINQEGTCYLRLGRGGEKSLHQQVENFEIGKAIKIQEGKDIAIFSAGAILDVAMDVRKKLEDKGWSVAEYSFPTVKPIDKKTIIENSNNCKVIITIEEHNIIGGFGSAVSEVMAEVGGKAKLMRFGLNDTYSSIIGNQDYLREVYGISSNKIVEKIYNKISET